MKGCDTDELPALCSSTILHEITSLLLRNNAANEPVTVITTNEPKNILAVAAAKEDAVTGVGRAAQACGGGESLTRVRRAPGGSPNRPPVPDQTAPDRFRFEAAQRRPNPKPPARVPPNGQSKRSSAAAAARRRLAGPQGRLAGLVWIQPLPTGSRFVRWLAGLQGRRTGLNPAAPHRFPLRAVSRAVAAANRPADASNR
nr:unnamed protein product [Digitaria exilis]